MAVYDTLVGGLDEMEDGSIDRVVLALYESEPSDNSRGRWLTSRDNNYYPFEILSEEEQRMILDKKHYTVVALVRSKVNGFVQYPDRGVEKYQRTRVNPFLPSLKPESTLNYVTEGEIYYGEKLIDYAKIAEESGWTVEAIAKCVDESIQKQKGKRK